MKQHVGLIQTSFLIHSYCWFSVWSWKFFINTASIEAPGHWPLQNPTRDVSVRRTWVPTCKMETDHDRKRL